MVLLTFSSAIILACWFSKHHECSQYVMTLAHVSLPIKVMKYHHPVFLILHQSHHR